MAAARRASSARAEHPVSDAAAREQRRRATRRIPTTSCAAFVKRSAEAGIDVFRIFDSLNSTDNMQLAIEAVRERHRRDLRRRRSAIPATSSIRRGRNTRCSTTCGWRSELVEMGTHVLGIKDMAGLCKPYAAYALVKALREEVGVPIHFHTHDTSGINAGSILRAADAGVDIADAALASMSGMTSQPSLNGIVAALRNTERDTGLDQEALDELSRLLGGGARAVLPVRRRAEGAGPGRLSARDAGRPVHQSPAAGEESRAGRSLARKSAEAYAAANQLVGDIVKVTPSSKVVGDLALFHRHQQPDGRRCDERADAARRFRAASSR